MQRSAFTLIFFLLIMSINPVSAGAIDNGAEMVAKGIMAYENLKAEKMLETNFGVTLGNTSGMENLTPSQKLVYQISAAEQSPFKVPWVMKTFTYDVVYYCIFCVMIICLCVATDMAQEKYPEKIADLNNKFTGRDNFFDYSFSLQMTAKLALAPILLFFALDTLFTLEQLWSSGYAKNSLEYIGFSTGTSGIWLFESITYAMNSGLFALRIQYMNEFVANSLKLIILYIIPWGLFTFLAQIAGAWFLSSLFMRPVVMMYSAKAVQDIAQQTSTVAKIGSTIGNMTLVSVLTFITALVMVLGPILWIAYKILVHYMLGAGYKLIKISHELNRARRAKN